MPPRPSRLDPAASAQLAADLVVGMVCKLGGDTIAEGRCRWFRALPAPAAWLPGTDDRGSIRPRRTSCFELSGRGGRRRGSRLRKCWQLYKILAGRMPLDGDGTADVLRKVANEPPAPPRSVCSAVPPALEAVCLKAMAKRPADRYGSARPVPTPDPRSP